MLNPMPHRLCPPRRHHQMHQGCPTPCRTRRLLIPKRALYRTAARHRTLLLAWYVSCLSCEAMRGQIRPEPNKGCGEQNWHQGKWGQSMGHPTLPDSTSICSTNISTWEPFNIAHILHNLPRHNSHKLKWTAFNILLPRQLRRTLL